MNERIRQLAKQAEQYADDTMNADPAKYDKPGQVKVWRELMQRKFAELLIQECLFIIDDEQSVDRVSRIELWHQIRKHFGGE